MGRSGLSAPPRKMRTGPPELGEGRAGPLTLKRSGDTELAYTGGAFSYLFDPGDPPGARGRRPCPAHAASRPAPDTARRSANQSARETLNGRRRHPGAAGVRSALRAPDAPLEPQDAPLHLR